MRMKSPVHPGEVLLHDCILASGLTVKNVAEAWGIDFQDLQDVCNGKAPITGEIVRKAGAKFGGRSEILLKMQKAFDESANPCPMETADV